MLTRSSESIFNPSRYTGYITESTCLIMHPVWDALTLKDQDALMASSEKNKRKG